MPKLLTRTATYVMLGFWAVFCLFPVYWLAITSIRSVDDIDQGPAYVPFVDFLPTSEAWNFILFSHYDNLGRRFVNSLAIGMASTVISLLVGTMAIYGLTRFRPSLRWLSLVALCPAAGLALTAAYSEAKLILAGLVLALLALGFYLRRWGPAVGSFGMLAFLLATRILPPSVLVLPIYIMAMATGMLDTRTWLVLVYVAINLPVAVWLLQPVLGVRATDQEEAAQLDGASHLAIFFGILLPMVRASVAATGLLVFLMCWNEYLFAAYLAADNAMTLSPWMVGQLSVKEAQVGGDAEEREHLAAAAVFMAIPAIIFAAYAQRLLARSLVGGR